MLKLMIRTLGLVYINNMVLGGSPLTILSRAYSTETAINLYMSYIELATAGEKQDSNNCWFRLYCASVAVVAYDVRLQRKDGRELDWQFNQEKCMYRDVRSVPPV